MESLSKAPITVRARAMKRFLMGKKEYLPKKKTNADLDSIMKCALCPNMCRFDCPISEAAKKETLSPSGKSRLALLYEMDQLEPEKAKNILYTCCNCDACKQWCPFDFSLGDLLKGVHQDLVDQNQIPDNVKKIKDELNEKHILGENKINKEPENKQAQILYFMGCSVQSEQENIANSMISILEKSKTNFTFLKDEWCCGAPLYNLGFIKEFKEFAKKNIDEIKKTECKTLVCSCPTCTYIFKNIYSEIGFKLDIEILHTSEYLNRIISKSKMKEIKKKCVYHDPCTLVRKLNIFEEPRQLLEKIPMLEVIEPFFNKNNTQCCGRGGSLERINSDISNTIAKKRVEDLKKDADIIITSCPTCKTAFKNQNCQVFDISEIVNMSFED